MRLLCLCENTCWLQVYITNMVFNDVLSVYMGAFLVIYNCVCFFVYLFVCFFFFYAVWWMHLLKGLYWLTEVDWTLILFLMYWWDSNQEYSLWNLVADKLLSLRTWVELLIQCSGWKDQQWYKTVTLLHFLWNISRRIWGWLLLLGMEMRIYASSSCCKWGLAVHLFYLSPNVIVDCDTSGWHGEAVLGYNIS